MTLEHSDLPKLASPAQRALAAAGIFAVSAEAREEFVALSRQVEEALARTDRCRVEEVEEGRFLFHNFRRQAGGAPRRILL